MLAHTACNKLEKVWNCWFGNLWGGGGGGISIWNQGIEAQQIWNLGIEAQQIWELRKYLESRI